MMHEHDGRDDDDCRLLDSLVQYTAAIARREA